MAKTSARFLESEVNIAHDHPWHNLDSTICDQQRTFGSRFVRLFSCFPL